MNTKAKKQSKQFKRLIKKVIAFRNSNISFNELLNKKTPFAVVQYFEYLVLNPSAKYKKYSLTYLKRNFKLKEIDLSDLEVSAFKSNLHQFDIVEKTKDGTVYEFLSFKDFYNKKCLNKKKFN